MEEVRLISRCKARAENPYKPPLETQINRDGSLSVFYAKGKSCNPHEFTKAGLSILPIAHNGHAVEKWIQNGKDWETFYGVNDWKPEIWRKSYGVQVFTGEVSNYLTELDFEYEIIRDHPGPFAEMLQRLCDLTPTPLLIITKRGGLRFSSHTPGYVHSNKTEHKEYIGDYSVDPRRLYLEVFGEKGLSRYDYRYEIVEGSPWKIPEIPADAIFRILDDYRYEIGTLYQKQKPKGTSTPAKKRRKKRKTSAKKVKGVRPTAEYDANGKPIEIEWQDRDKKGIRRSKQVFACNMTEHGKSDGDMVFYQEMNGRVTQFCHNCKELKELVEGTDEPRYRLNAEHVHETSDLETERAANKSVLKQWLEDTKKKRGKHLLILGSAAGTGKTTVTITTADAFTYIAKTTEEANSVHAILDAREEDCHRHRSRLYNRDHPEWETLPLGLGENERPCIKPELCNLHAERLGTPNAICSRCPALLICQESAYKYQHTLEQNTSKVIYAETESYTCDEIYKARVKRIIRKGDILIVDEVNPLALTQHRVIHREMLYDLVERFKMPGTSEAYETLKALLDLTSTAETPETFIAGLRTWLEGIADVEALDEKMERYPVGVVFSKAGTAAAHNEPFEAKLCYQDIEVTVPVVSRETADDTPCYFIEDTTQIELEKWHVRFMPYSFLVKVGLATLANPPPRYQHTLRSLQTFVAENPTDATAPFTFDAKAQRFEYHLKPTLNHRRVIFNTASDPDNLIGEAYRDMNVQITRHTGETPAWKKGFYFQISTGNYLPRHSLVCREGKKLTLKPRAKERIDQFIVPSIEAGLKVLIVAPKAFQEIPYIQALECEVINHHHAEGRNDFQDFDIAFIFHYEPNHNTVPIDAKHIFQNADPPLDFTRAMQDITVNGVTFKKQAYVDERVQAVYNRECRQRLMQSGMRLRPNINPGKIIVYLTAEPIDIPVTPVPFRPTDAQHFTGDWAAFQEKLQAIAQAEADGDVKGVAETQGVSERTARRKTAETRKQNKAERDSEIRRRFARGESKKQIATEMKIGQGTVKRVLEDQPF